MAEIISGQDALDVMENDGNSGGGGNRKEFSSFKVGSKYVVKVIGNQDLFGFYSYGIFEKVNSFVAKNPSKKTDKGFPIDNLTSWDKAFMYHNDKSKEFMDEESKNAYLYKPSLRYALGFFDLDSGERIVIDVSKKQAQTLRKSIVKQDNKGKLNKTFFELEKETGGVVSLTPNTDLDDLTDKQRENFDKAPEEFNISEFTEALFEYDDDEMLRKLHYDAGFDVTKIGYDVPEQKTEGETNGGEGSTGNAIDIGDDDLPF